ncbi:Rv2578c family radical SAM protein [Isoptericola halotolerans]|uniref:DNA repair photolyase n=1 Tax=Isoptericola halotolerans TaxID=300560 RepID=A0ABX2A8N6_9MICO|nr:Rv2578c family radical SAM protein [Isoptericola halotolerans]NOV97963.1 DNA repair photolyase [Isoptericola halotolerans]
MRWDAQSITADDGALPGLDRTGLARAGLVRTVRTPEFAGITFHEVLAKSALSKVPAASRMPFGWTVNPYRGCSHACRYCFARPTHEYLDLDAGKDFDSEVVVKTNVDDVLRAELARPSWRREAVALGTNTDPYQRAEGRYRLMPGIITALADSGTPFSILTKGTLLRRDLPLIAEAAERVEVGLGVSLAFVDEKLQQQVEPGTPTPRARLDLVRAVRDAGLPCGVMVAPVLPWLTDSTDHLRRLLDAVGEAGATGVTVVPLHLKPGTREWYLQWLQQDHPHLVAGYDRVFAGGTYALKAYREWLWERVRPLLDEHGFGRSGHRSGSGATGRRGELRPHGEGDYPVGSMVESSAGGAVAGMPRHGGGVEVAGAQTDQALF